MDTKVFLSFGSNLGNEIETINNAITLLEDLSIIKVEKVSSFYKSEPYGNSNQNWFINSALCGITKHSATLLLYYCKIIEYYLGRETRGRWEEREIDIDIIFFENKIVNLEFLRIPHPEIPRRNFVLIPMNEIASDFIHPELGISIKELLLNSKDTLLVEKLTV